MSFSQCRPMIDLNTGQRSQSACYSSFMMLCPGQINNAFLTFLFFCTGLSFSTSLQGQCTQFLTLLSGTVFHVFHMVWCVLFQVLGPEITFRLKDPETILSQMDHTIWKGMKIVPQNGIRSCWHFCLSLLLNLERCVSSVHIGYNCISSNAMNQKTRLQEESREKI